MEQDEAEIRIQPASVQQPEYPEPDRAAHNAYHAISESSCAALAESDYGVFSGPHDLSFGHNGMLPSNGSRHDPSPAQASSSNSRGLGAPFHHVTDFGSFGSDPIDSTQSHLLTQPTPLTDSQRLAQQFHVQNGDPGSNARPGDLVSPEQWSHLRDEGGEIGSDLAGIYQPDTGGKAAASRAYAAAHTYGGQFEWDESIDRGEGDLQEIFAQTDTEAAVPKRRLLKGRGGWRRLLQGTDHENIGRAKVSTRGRGTPRGRTGRRRGRGKPIDPGRDFKNFLAEANKAYLANDYEEAADNARQAIQANPEVYQAHALLATSLEAQGRFLEAAQSMILGAVTARNSEVWITTAEKFLRIAGGDHNLLRQGADCYAEALKCVKDDKPLELKIRDRALRVYQELNDVKACRLHCKHILKDFPLNLEYVQRFAILCVKWRDHAEIAKANQYYEQIFEKYESGELDLTTDEIWTSLNIYLEMHSMIGKPVDGIVACKRLSRWFLGRKAETFWDKVVLDDREFDKDNSRRNYVPEFQQGRASLDLNQYGEGLPIDIRVWLGLFRLQMGMEYHAEAFKHFEWLDEYETEVDDYDDLFKSVGNALKDSGKVQDAAKYYDILRRKIDADDPDYGLGEEQWMKIANCYHMLGRFQDAILSFENVRLRKGSNYNRACARLAKLYEDTGETEKSRFLCNEVIKLNRRELLYEAQVKSIPAPTKGRGLPMSAGPPPVAMPPPLPPLPAPRPLQMKPMTPIRPLVPFTSDSASQARFADPSSGSGTSGPLSQSVVMPPIPPESLDVGKKKKPRGKKRGILTTLCGEFDEPEGERYAEAGLKRPRLKRKYVKKSETLEQQERSRVLQDAKTRMVDCFAIIQALWPVFREGSNPEATEQWSSAAHAMLDEFRAMKVFFPDRDQYIRLRASGDDAKRPFLQDFDGKGIMRDSPKQFLSISFKDWQHVFVDLALMYVRTGEQDRCYKIVQEVLCSANVFYQDFDLNQISYGTAVHVGLAFNDSQYLIQLARQVIASKPADYRNSMGFQLFAAVARFSYGSNWFISGPTQKFMLRMVKQSDYMSMSPDVRKKVDWSAQGPSLVVRSQNYPKEDEPDAHILTMYGHMVAAANHSFSALPYYYRALALQPENICVNLSIATMWIQYSMKRQVDNRQEGITNGLSFLYRYYGLRVRSGKAGHIQEAEYNVARMWHYLGLTHLALPAYEKVLQLSERVQAEKFEVDGPLEYDVEDYAQEAAYALSNIYSLVGNEEAARAITEQWLVI